MDKKLFAELVTSLKEAAAISKGKARPSRKFRVEAPDAKVLFEYEPAACGDGRLER